MFLIVIFAFPHFTLFVPAVFCFFASKCQTQGIFHRFCLLVIGFCEKKIFVQKHFISFFPLGGGNFILFSEKNFYYSVLQFIAPP